MWTIFSRPLPPRAGLRASFHLKKQDRVVTFRISSNLLESLKRAAKKHQVQYQRLIRFILEENVAHYLR